MFLHVIFGFFLGGVFFVFLVFLPGSQPPARQSFGHSVSREGWGAWEHEQRRMRSKALEQIEIRIEGLRSINTRRS